MQFFFVNCTHMLTRTQGKKFEVMFLVKIVSQGTSLRYVHACNNFLRLQCVLIDKKGFLHDQPEPPNFKSL